MNLKNKFNGSINDSNAACLIRLYSEKSIDYNHSFLGYMNNLVFINKAFSEFSKTKLLKIKNNKIFINDGIEFNKESLELISDPTILEYFSPK